MTEREKFEMALASAGLAHISLLFNGERYVDNAIDNMWWSWQSATKAAVPEWISVSEQLPPNDVSIDIYAEITAGDAKGDAGRFTDCFYNAGARMYWCWDDGEIQPMGSINVTHWMHRPAAPEIHK